MVTVSVPPPDRVTACHTVPAAVFRKNISLLLLLVSPVIRCPVVRSEKPTAALALAVFTITRDSITGLRLRSVENTPNVLNAAALPTVALDERRLAPEIPGRLIPISPPPVTSSHNHPQIPYASAVILFCAHIKSHWNVSQLELIRPYT